MATITDPVVRAHKREIIEKAFSAFCGDSGDGMQITGSQFTNTVALYGNTWPPFRLIPPKFALSAGRFLAQRLPNPVFLERCIHPGRLRGPCWCDEPAALKTNIKI